VVSINTLGSYSVPSSPQTYCRMNIASSPPCAVHIGVIYTLLKCASVKCTQSLQHGLVITPGEKKPPARVAVLWVLYFSIIPLALDYTQEWGHLAVTLGCIRIAVQVVQRLHNRIRVYHAS